MADDSYGADQHRMEANGQPPDHKPRRVAPLHAALGAVLRERRKARGWKLADVSVRAGVSLGYLSQVELGKNEPSVAFLSRVAAVLGAYLSVLLAEAERRAGVKNPAADAEPDRALESLNGARPFMMPAGNP